MRTCENCGKNFEASSNHNNCPSCRYQKSKTVLCIICKEQLHSTKYKNCILCTNTVKPNYGTGRYLKNGYVMIFQKGHPRATGSRCNYVFEHIIVMEKHLGRFLHLNENIHHKNGNREDNEIDNLELWIKPQPAGVRAKDALEWAKRIVAIYEPIQRKL